MQEKIAKIRRSGRVHSPEEGVWGYDQKHSAGDVRGAEPTEEARAHQARELVVQSSRSATQSPPG